MFGLMIAVALSMLLPNVSEAAAKKPAAVKAKTVKVYKSTSNTKTATVKVKWKKAKNAKKYRVAYKAKSKKSWKKVTTKKTAVTLKNLKGNTKYSVKVRSLNGKKYSKYSKAKTFKTKKLVKKPSKPDEPKPPIDEKPELKIDKSEVTLYVKDGYTATVTASGIDTDKLTWESSDEAVATVENGVITPGRRRKSSDQCIWRRPEKRVSGYCKIQRISVCYSERCTYVTLHPVTANTN